MQTCEHQCCQEYPDIHVYIVQNSIKNKQKLENIHETREFAKGKQVTVKRFRTKH